MTPRCLSRGDERGGEGDGEGRMEMKSAEASDHTLEQVQVDK